MNKLILLALSGAVLIPAAAHAGDHDRRDGRRADRHSAIFTDSNKFYLDYKTDNSAAERELKSDLRRAENESDRIEAYAEYEAELADAEKDFRKEMAERGLILPRGTVTVEEASVRIPPRYRSGRW